MGGWAQRKKETQTASRKKDIERKKEREIETKRELSGPMVSGVDDRVSATGTRVVETNGTTQAGLTVLLVTGGTGFLNVGLSGGATDGLASLRWVLRRGSGYRAGFLSF